MDGGIVECAWQRHQAGKGIASGGKKSGACTGRAVVVNQAFVEKR